MSAQSPTSFCYNNDDYSINPSKASELGENNLKEIQ